MKKMLKLQKKNQSNTKKLVKNNNIIDQITIIIIIIIKFLVQIFFMKIEHILYSNNELYRYN